MALRSLCSLVRGATRARICSSSPGIAVQGALGSAAGSEADTLKGLRNLAYHVDAHPFPAAAAICGSRGLHNLAATQTAQSIRARAGCFLPGIVVQASTGLGSGARRFHSLRDLVTKHAHGSRAALIAAAFSVSAGCWYMIDTDVSSDKARIEKDTEAEAWTEEDDPSMRTEAYQRYLQALKDMQRETASYNKPLPGGNKALDQEGMKDDDDEAMRARFEDWMKQYGRAYQDEEEKARRFRIFKATARFVDAANARIRV